MLRLTKRADYGLMAIHFIASQGEDEVVSAKRIAEQFRIPPERLAKILQRLAKKGIIAGHNGSKGGYVLARSADQVTVGEVVRALEGPIRIVSCLAGEDDCPQFTNCNLRTPAQRLQASISDLLDDMTLADLGAAPARPVAVPLSLSLTP